MAMSTIKTEVPRVSGTGGVRTEHVRVGGDGRQQSSKSDSTHNA